MQEDDKATSDSHSQSQPAKPSRREFLAGLAVGAAGGVVATNALNDKSSPKQSGANATSFVSKNGKAILSLNTDAPAFANVNAISIGPHEVRVVDGQRNSYESFKSDADHVVVQLNGSGQYRPKDPIVLVAYNNAPKEGHDHSMEIELQSELGKGARRNMPLIMDISRLENTTRISSYIPDTLTVTGFNEKQSATMRELLPQLDRTKGDSMNIDIDHNIHFHAGTDSKVNFNIGKHTSKETASSEQSADQGQSR